MVAAVRGVSSWQGLGSAFSHLFDGPLGNLLGQVFIDQTLFTMKKTQAERQMVFPRSHRAGAGSWCQLLLLGLSPRKEPSCIT